ncbi:shugoshin-like [Drosophila kikkawai]|uniref:Shugoshin-like n=1 Tax=Drosophila kikkawai TaxID=30033 RepID=A0A6P4IKX6_DROKI|nr:uncharacterized protein LOC108076035 [Drosophila kikkawai]
MSSNKESYKVLNAELMAEVQKLRLMIAAYKRQVSSLLRENMGLREAQILQRASGGGQQRRWKLDSNCLGATRPAPNNRRRYGDMDIALEVSEEAPEIGRLKLSTPPIVPTIDEDDPTTTSGEDEGWQSANKDGLIRKIARSCWRRAKIIN